jgi:proteasome accessory factor B
VVNRLGRWYVAGRDRDRDAERVFRLSRIAGPVRFSGPAGSITVPADIDVRQVVRSFDSSPGRENTAVLRVRAGAGYGLRRYAAVPAVPAADGWDTVKVPYTELSYFADQVASFGADVVVIEPPDLRDAVIRRLKGALT